MTYKLSAAPGRLFFKSILLFIFTLAASLVHSADDSSDKAAKRGLVPTDYFDFVFPNSPDISPNGEQIVFTNRGVKDDANGRYSHIYLLENGEPPRRFTQGEKDRSPQWSPDGQHIAFTRSVDDKAQVFIIPSKGGEASQATQIEASLSGFQWLPDSSGFLLSLRVDADKAEQQDANKGDESENNKDNENKRAEPDMLVIKDARYIANGTGYLDSKRQHLFSFDLESSELKQLTESTEWNANSPSLSKNGDYVYFHANKTGLEYEGDVNNDIYQLSLTDDTLSPLTSHPHSQIRALPSPDGKAIAYLHNEDDFTQRDLWVMNSDGTQEKNLSADFDRDITLLSWSADSNSIYFSSADHGAERIYSLNVSTTEVKPLIAEDKTQANFSLSSSGEFAVFTLEDSVNLPELYQYQFDTGELQQLTYFNASLLSQLALSPAQSTWIENDKGMKIQGFVHKPLGHKTGEKFPLVLNIKGGPGGMWGHRWFHENQMYVAKGYGVVYVNYRGSSGYGFEHSNAVRLDYGGADYEDNIQFLNAMIAQHPWIDTQRLYITGGSHGGFLTNWITTKTDRFKAAVTQRSVSSWISEAGTQEFTPLQMSKEFGGNLWENFDYYWDRSPLQFADKVSTPTLIIHSDQDMITPIGQGQEWFYALKANNVPTEMVIFKGETHSLSRSGTPTNLVARLEKILEWFERYGQ